MPVALAPASVALPRQQLWRVTDRATFAALRASRARGRSGPVTVTWLAPSEAQASEPPRAAFTVGTRTGGAVVRNRVRRRLRAALRELQTAGDLPAGTYLLGARAEVATLGWAAVVDHVRAAVREAQR